MGATEPHELLARLGAYARPAGSAAEATARRLCSEVLRAAGFEVVERPFSYSAFPGVYGAPLIGSALVLTAAVTAFALRHSSSVDTQVERALAIVAIIAIISWWLSRYGTRHMPLMRREGMNLEACRGVPDVWLIAHLDSKSQSISLLTRAVSSVAVVGFWLAVAIVLLLSRVVPVPVTVMGVLVACAGLAAVPLALARTGSNGAGTLDNASGVASIIVAARRMDCEIPVGLLVTSAEELGLAGARAWVERKPRGVAINCDGIDDVGDLTVTASGQGREIVNRLSRCVFIGRKVRIRRSLPGVLLDSAAFSDCGWAACTVSQGNLKSLGRTHTRRDCPDECAGSGVERAGELIAMLAGAIIAEGSGFASMDKGLARA